MQDVILERCSKDAAMPTCLLEHCMGVCLLISHTWVLICYMGVHHANFIIPTTSQPENAVL